jgi:thioredoxin family protein
VATRFRARSRAQRTRITQEEPVSTSVVTPERFAQGRTFDQYVTHAGSAENLQREAWGGYHPDAGSLPAPRKDNSAVFRDRYARTRLADHQVAAIRWLASQPGGPAKMLVISEDWSSDCRRDVPALARLAEAGGLELRIFDRDGKKILGTRRPDPVAYPDGNHDLMLELMNTKNGAEWASVPAVGIYTRDFRLLHRYHEYPAIYHKDRVRGGQQARRAGESAADAEARGSREFAAMQASPFFDLWACAAIDEILSALYERLTVRDA